MEKGKYSLHFRNTQPNATTKSYFITCEIKLDDKTLAAETISYRVKELMPMARETSVIKCLVNTKLTTSQRKSILNIYNTMFNKEKEKVDDDDTSNTEVKVE